MHQGQLSQREREVAALVARGLTNAEIALSLGLSASTVKHYVETAMRKAGVTNCVSLALWWRDHEEGSLGTGACARRAPTTIHGGWH